MIHQLRLPLHRGAARFLPTPRESRNAPLPSPQSTPPTATADGLIGPAFLSFNMAMNSFEHRASRTGRVHPAKQKKKGRELATSRGGYPRGREGLPPQFIALVIHQAVQMPADTFRADWLGVCA